MNAQLKAVAVHALVALATVAKAPGQSIGDLPKTPIGVTNVVPALADNSTLWAVTASGIVPQRNVTLYTRYTAPLVLRVAGNPAQYRTSQTRYFTNAVWKSATVSSGGSMNPVVHSIEGSDGAKTIYLQLANRYGVSPIYSVTVTFYELYHCRISYERADNALAPTGVPQGNLGVESAVVPRAESKTLNVDWPSANEKRIGYGMHLRRARNTGLHPIRLTIGGGLVWQSQDIAPGETKLYRHDLKQIHCIDRPVEGGARAIQ